MNAPSAGTGAWLAPGADPTLFRDMVDEEPGHVDPADIRLALHGPAHLRSWNEAGVLVAADVHVARSLAGRGDHLEPDVVLAVALAVRALRLGHVCVDLAVAARTVATDLDASIDPSELPWPHPGGWVEAVAASAVVAVGDADPSEVPLRLVGTRLYLDRYWRQELDVAADLRARSALPPPDIDATALADGLDALFGPTDPEPGPGGLDREPDLQRLAAAAAVANHFSLIAGGPGTGKTTTVARILALLEMQAGAQGRPPPRIALAAPTGKAAARLQEAVHAEARRLPLPDALRTRLLEIEASTLHRLLGWRPGSHSRFRHDRQTRLPHTVVIVDETSMLSLSLMAKLVDAVRSDARLILLGDPQQLASVEAGSVLGDVVGPAEAAPQMTAATRARLAEVTRQPVPAVAPAIGAPVGNGIVILRHVHRFGGGIAALADAVRTGDAGAAAALITGGGADVAWLDLDITAPTDRALADVAAEVTAAGGARTAAAARGDGRAALAALGSTRILCPHRRGPAGVEVWSQRVEGWLGADSPAGRTRAPWYEGRPLLVTDNDYELQLFNGDTGVVIRGPDGEPVAVFERRGELVTVSPGRLGGVVTMHAMTIHKSQGSQFDAVTVVLPEVGSPILTRQLLYTALTRATERVTVVGAVASLRAAIDRPITRASGLGERLWA